MIIKVYAPGTPSKLGAILQRITNLTEVRILSMYLGYHCGSRHVGRLNGSGRNIIWININIIERGVL